MNRKIKVVVIDTGVDQTHPYLKNANIDGVCLIPNFEQDDISDEIGHGTAVTSIILRCLPEAQIFMVKIFDKYPTLEGDLFISALEYILENLEPDIINMSLGITMCDDLIRLRQIIGDFANRGVTLIAAFDNGGTVSYPAAFPNVIGVDCHLSVHSPQKYIYVKNSAVNILGYAQTQRVPWLKKGFSSVAGASFVAPFITGVVGGLLAEGFSDTQEILNQLQIRADSTKELSPSNYPVYSQTIKKAIIFPYNKEIKTLNMFKDMLNFQIEGFYAPKGLAKETWVKDWKKIDWKNDFDTVILGHLKRLEMGTGIDFTPQFLENCYKYRKNIYAFDDLSPYQNMIDKMKDVGLNIFYPTVHPEFLPENPMGKLRRFGKPILCIAGTGSKEGKFSLQLGLRKALLNKGYQIGQLGTEPTALLFSMDEVFPYGYNSTVYLDHRQTIQAVNFLIGRIEDTSPDLILMGLQSHTVPQSMGALNFYPDLQTEIILGAEPDAFLLCVNIFDDLEYIRRSINYLESLTEATVAALVVSPIPVMEQYTMFGSKILEISLEDKTSFQKLLESNFDKPVFLGEASEIDSIATFVEDYFSS